MHEIKVIKSERVGSLGYRTAGRCPISNYRTWSGTQLRTAPTNVQPIMEFLRQNLKPEVLKSEN